MRARPTHRTVMALLTALLLLTSAGPTLVSAATESALQQAEPFGWWMEPRYEEGWRRYDPESHSYPSDYIYPAGWQVGFDGCQGALAADRDATSFRWQVMGVELDYAFDSGAVSACRLDSATSPAAPALPAEGLYLVTLTVAYADGGEASASLEIEVEDLLIVSIGDSNAAGEGNPHINQVGGLRPADDVWFERRCHRSANSGHALAAAAIERNDPHSAVTFLSFACSGAEIWSGLVSQYYGIETPDNALSIPLDPQLLALMQHLCVATETPGCVDNPRRVDSLFLSIGVNDLGFSTIIKSCAGRQTLDEMLVEDVFIAGVIDSVSNGDWEALATYPLDRLLAEFDRIATLLTWIADLFGLASFACEEELDPLIDMNLATLWAHYDLLAEMLDGDAAQIAADLRDNPNSHYWMSPSVRARFLDFYGDLPAAMTTSIQPRNVYITSYPDDPFTDATGNHGGCGVFRLINADEARWIRAQGPRLNQRIEWAATANRWHYVDGIAAAFEGHGYCAGDERYFVELSDSLLQQFNIDGTLHPNRDGHAVTRDRLLDAYYSAKPDWSSKHAMTIKVESVRIVDGRENPQAQATFTAKVHDEWYRHEPMINQLDVPVGQWVDLPAGRFEFEASLADDDVITVLAYTAVGGGLYYPPKCNSPQCAQAIEATRLGVTDDYALANGWGRDLTWCQAEPGIKAFRTERVCTVNSTHGGHSLEVRYRIIVWNPPFGPLDLDPEDQVTCGPNCQGPPPPPPYPLLAEYLARLEAAGEDATLIVTLLDYLEQYAVAR